MPGEPPSSTSDPGTMPPPRTRSSSPMPVEKRGICGACTLRSGMGLAGAPAPAALPPGPRRPRAGPGRAAPPRPACSTRRRPGSARATWRTRARRRSRRRRWRTWPCAESRSRGWTFSPPQDGRPSAVRASRFHAAPVDLLDQPCATAEYLAVDTETNGRGGDLCEMTEVGAVLVGGGELHDSFESLVAVERPLSRGIERLTGITQQMVDTAPPPAEVLQRAGRADGGPGAGGPQRLVRLARAGAGLRARRAGVARPARAVHGGAGAQVRAAGAPAQARAAGRRAGDRGRRGAPGAARRHHLRADPVRAVPAPVRGGADGGRRRGRADLGRGGAAAGSRRSRRARRAPEDRPGHEAPAQGPRRVRVPRRARPAAVRGQVGLAAHARAGALLRPVGLDRARRGGRLPAHELRAGRAGAGEPADQAVAAAGEQGAQAHRQVGLRPVPAGRGVPGPGGVGRAGARGAR